MASGDPIFIQQEAQAAGVAPYFNYTTTVTMVITGWSNIDNYLNLGTWVDYVSGNYAWLPENYDVSSQTGVNGDAKNRLVLLAGKNLTGTNNNINRFGTFICGFEL